jgi:hypothetical protein
MSAWLAEPGGLQVQAALKLLAGGLADGAVVVEPGEFGVLGGIEVTAQFPVGQAVRFRCLGAVDAGAGAPRQTCPDIQLRVRYCSVACPDHDWAAGSESSLRGRFRVGWALNARRRRVRAGWSLPEPSPPDG